MRGLGLPDTLAGYSIPESDFAVIAAESLPSGSLKANPKTVTEDDLLDSLAEVSPAPS